MFFVSLNTLFKFNFLEWKVIRYFERDNPKNIRSDTKNDTLANQSVTSSRTRALSGLPSSGQIQSKPFKLTTNPLDSAKNDPETTKRHKITLFEWTITTANFHILTFNSNKDGKLPQVRSRTELYCYIDRLLWSVRNSGYRTRRQRRRYRRRKGEEIRAR